MVAERGLFRHQFRPNASMLYSRRTLPLISAGLPSLACVYSVEWTIKGTPCPVAPSQRTPRPSSDIKDWQWNQLSSFAQPPPWGPKSSVLSPLVGSRSSCNFDVLPPLACRLWLGRLLWESCPHPDLYLIDEFAQTAAASICRAAFGRLQTTTPPTRRIKLKQRWLPLSEPDIPAATSLIWTLERYWCCVEKGTCVEILARDSKV